jgi:16S rRNA (guanine527-N7)-methyltransferase
VSDWERRLGDLAAQYDLSAAQTGALRGVLELLRDDPVAPTTVRDPAAAVDAHVADSLVALELDAVRDARTIADLGAGAGFPGLPLAVALPDARVWLVESVSRKCAFLERAVAAAGAANAEVACGRVESWAVREVDLVCVRAVAPLAVLAEYAAPLLRVGGGLVAWKGRRDAAEERGGAAAAERLGLELASVVPVRPFPAAEYRHLHLYSKVRLTSPEFPRRPGMARKRPLSG